MLYFATRNPTMKRQMVGVAGADLLSDFGRGSWTQLVDGPILAPEYGFFVRRAGSPAIHAIPSSSVDKASCED